MNKIVGSDSAYTVAKEMPYASNMTISAALVVEMVERIAELENHIQSLKVINEYIDEGCPDMQVVRSEIGEVISRAEGTYLKAVKEQDL